MYEPTKSRHPAHTFRMSARDLARFGQLYLQEGRWDGRQKLVESILAARRHEPQSRPQLRALQPTALASQLPPATIPEYRPLASSTPSDYLGDYELTAGAARLAGRTLTPGGTVRVFLFGEKPYMHLPGAGDALMFPTGRDTFTIRAAPGVAMAFERGANGAVTAVALTIGDRTTKASSTQLQ